MKKLFSLLFSVLLLASLAAPAFAVTAVGGEITVVYDLPHAGIRVTFPQEFAEAEGVVLCTQRGKLVDRDLYVASFVYYGLSPEEWEEFDELERRKQDLTEEEYERWVSLGVQNAFLPGFLACEDESEVESYKQYSVEVGFPYASVIKLGEADGYSFFYTEDEITKIETLRPQYAEVYRKLAAIMKEAAQKAEFFAPTEPEDPWTGRVLRFETTDLDGNTVRSDELFAEHDITMLNFWATWCEPCKRELRELGDINRRMQEENCAVVGILYDEDDEETIELAKALLEENGVDYMNLKMPESLDEAEIAVSRPTSVFVDSSGVIIAPVITGAFVDLYEPRFRGLLDGTEPAPADAAAGAAEESSSDAGRGIDYLALVNKLNPLPEGWEDALETVTITNSVGDEVEVEKKAYDAYLALKEDLEKNDGIYLELDSARRSVAAQQDIMDRFIEKYGADYAAKTVATPGYSEHHTGLALDLYFKLKGDDGEFTDVYYNEDMVKYPEVWEKIHARLADYGFILRYLEGREHITGYGYEPWHIRYIDNPELAKEITEAGITLEEYLGAATNALEKIDLGKSEIYTEEDLRAASIQILCKFATFEGCELHNLRYAGDENCTEENLKWMNELNEDGNYTQAAQFLMDFHSPKEQVGVWEADREYTDYGWWLARGDGSGWEVVTQGYG